MDYTRKQRGVKYSSPVCKMYLRHDFGHRCAYCGVIEESLTDIPEAADKLFEKDHFLPQTPSFQGMHNYENLYYACCQCNGVKNNIRLPLDPCKDDVLLGANPHIVGGTASTKYLFESVTEEGNKYIAHLQLNSRYHLGIRKHQQEWLATQQEAKALMAKIKEESNLDGATLAKIELAMFGKSSSENFAYVLGGSPHALDIAEACQCLVNKGYRTEVVLEEYELDVKVTIESNVYWGQIRPSDTPKECRIKTSTLKEWKKHSDFCGVFRYISSENSICLYIIDFKKVNWDKIEYHVSEYTKL